MFGVRLLTRWELPRLAFGLPVAGPSDSSLASDRRAHSHEVFHVVSTRQELPTLLFWIAAIKHCRIGGSFLIALGANPIVVYSADVVLRGWLHRVPCVLTVRYQRLGEFASVGPSCTLVPAMWGSIYRL